MEKIRVIEEGIASPTGFKVNGTSCGLKDGGFKDIGLILSIRPCEVACAFTSNNVKAAPVLYDISIANNKISAIIVNSGNANCLTGKTGEKNVIEMAERVENLLGLQKGSVMVASTGVIGRKLNMDRVNYGIDRLCNVIRNESNNKNFCHAIMTTDTRVKSYAVEFTTSDGKLVKLGGVAKGAGMIKPDLVGLHATMLVFLTTDINIERKLLQTALNEIIEITFNRISVDNDTSTNDSVFLLANGMADNRLINDINSEDYKLFKEALKNVCENLAKMIVKDGEGITKVFKVNVINAYDDEEAKKIARTIADSYLVKTAMYGQSPNFGRILAAVGYSKCKFDLNKTKLYFNDVCIFSDGEFLKENEGKCINVLIQPELSITVDMGIGKSEYFLYTTDLTCEYVKINANYIS